MSTASISLARAAHPYSRKNDRLLWSALGISAALHALVLAVRFVDPDFLRFRTADSRLEVILVNARSQTRPTNAEAIAQANLDGGGANDAGRRKSPLPNMGKMSDGESVDSMKARVQQFEQTNRQRLALMAKGDEVVSERRDEVLTPVPEAGSADDTRTVLARLMAEISQQISDYQKRPRKHNFMPSTSESRFARYFEDWRALVERIGNQHYPAEARGKIYGDLQMTVSIGSDGRLVNAVIERSSGSPVLDAAARRIVKLAAPYPPFPPEIAKDTDVLEITRTWVFTNDQFATRSGEARSNLKR